MAPGGLNHTATASLAPPETAGLVAFGRLSMLQVWFRLPFLENDVVTGELDAAFEQELVQSAAKRKLSKSEIFRAQIAYTGSTAPSVIAKTILEDRCGRFLERHCS